MGHVRDRWTLPGENGRRVHGPRWGQGKRWQARWVEDGHERSAAFATKDAAELHIARKDAGVTGPVADGTTLRTWAEQWLADRLDLRRNSRTQIRSRLDARILPSFGDQPIAGITRPQVQAAITQWSAAGSAPRTVRSTHGTLSQILKAAMIDGLIAANPAKDIRLPRIDKRPLEIPDATKVHQVEAAMSAHLRSMVTVAAATGLRLGELRGLTVDCIKGDTLTVTQQRSLDGQHFAEVKTTAGVRTIHMGKVAREAIAAHLKAYGEGPEGLIWRTRDGKPLPQRVAVRAWARMRKKVAGLPARGGWHLLRHYNASVLIAAGLSVRAVADRLGHEDPAITLRTYSHLWPTDQSKATAAIDTALTEPKEKATSGSSSA